MVKIEKEQWSIIAYTSHYRIKGTVFIAPGGRLSDYISALGQKKFIAVTDAVVTDIPGNPICKAKFLELNKDEIMFIVPESDLKEE